MIAPEAFRDRSINALRATGWMAVPVMAEVVARLIHNGGLARQAKLKRDKAAVRDAIVRRVLKEWLPAATAAPGAANACETMPRTRCNKSRRESAITSSVLGVSADCRLFYRCIQSGDDSRIMFHSC